MHDIQIQSLLNEMIFIAFYRLQIRSLLNQMIFIVLQGKRCFLQISDRCIIFKSKVYWIKWLSSSCSQRCFLQISDRCMIFKSKVYWIKWFSSSYSSKGVSFKFQIDAWYSNPKSTESNDFHRLAVQKVFPSNFQIAMAFCFLPIYVTFSSFPFDERLS